MIWWLIYSGHWIEMTNPIKHVMNHHIFNWVLNSQLDFNSKFATLSSDTLVLDVLTSGGFVWFIYTVTRFDLSNESILKLRCNPPMNLWVFLRNYQYVAYPPDLIFIFHRIFCSYIYLLPGTKFHITQIDHILFGIICITSKFDLFLIFLIINENFKVIFLINEKFKVIFFKNHHSYLV